VYESEIDIRGLLIISIKEREPIEKEEKQTKGLFLECSK